MPSEARHLDDEQLLRRVCDGGQDHGQQDRPAATAIERRSCLQCHWGAAVVISPPMFAFGAALCNMGAEMLFNLFDGELEQLFGGRDRFRQGLDTRISAEQLVLTVRDPIAVARDLMSQHLGLVLVWP